METGGGLRGSHPLKSGAREGANRYKQIRDLNEKEKSKTGSGEALNNLFSEFRPLWFLTFFFLV